MQTKLVIHSRNYFHGMADTFIDCTGLNSHIDAFRHSLNSLSLQVDMSMLIWWADSCWEKTGEVSAVIRFLCPLPRSPAVTCFLDILACVCVCVQEHAGPSTGDSASGCVDWSGGWWWSVQECDLWSWDAGTAQRYFRQSVRCKTLRHKVSYILPEVNANK